MTSSSTSDSVCAADKVTRRRAAPCGTVGGRIATTQNPARARERCATKAYPVRECAGLLFAYMGPQPVPELPVWEPFTWANGFREVVLSDVPCNWFQCQENSCDPVHFEWMHDNWALRLAGRSGPYSGKHLKLKFEEFEDTLRKEVLMTIGAR